jgi:hypothetical protein
MCRPCQKEAKKYTHLFDNTPLGGNCNVCGGRFPYGECKKPPEQAV